MNIKAMPRSNKGHKYILYIIDKVTNYLITVSIYQSKAEEIGDALIEHELLNKRLKYLHKLLQDFNSKRLAMIKTELSFSTTTET